MFNTFSYNDSLLLNNSTIQILPTMNPWGFHQSPRIRYNSRNYDLNRNFPDQYINNTESEIIEKYLTKYNFSNLTIPYEKDNCFE